MSIATVHRICSLALFSFVVTVVLSLAGVDRAHAQAGLWTDIDPASLGAPPALAPAPAAFRTLRLDGQALLDVLAQAPLERTQAAAGSRVVLALPLPDGTFSRFRIVESPVMAPALAAKFPEIKTYAGQGLDDPTATTRFDWTPGGFHAMIRSRGGTVYIDPYRRGDAEHYISFFKRDARRSAALPFNDPDVVDEQGMAERVGALVQQGVVPSGAQLRTYRLAVATTGEYTQFHGGTVAAGLAAVVTAMNRVNEVYVNEVAVFMQLVANNDQIIFTDPATDPYSNNNGFTMLGQNQTTLDAVIGSANYDVGHVFSTGGGGVAGLGVVCNNLNKARGVTGLPNPMGDPFYIDYVAHEMGHQYGATHTFNGNTGACAGNNRTAATAYEPGSGTTIMAYAGICGSQNIQSNSDDHFHTASFDQIVALTTVGVGSTCAAVTGTGNDAPVPEAGIGGVTIPVSTPFSLIGSATDPNGDDLTYNWEEFDLGPAGHPNNPTGNAPLFRSFPSQPIPERVFPRLSDVVNNTQTIGEILPSYARSLTFRLTVRDNRAGGGGVDYDAVSFEVTDQAGPFLVTVPNTSVTWPAGSQQTVTWDVAGTDAAPVGAATVNILLSTDGGFTYPHMLAAGTPNDGSEEITIPGVPETTTARVKVEAADNIFFDISNIDFTIELSPMVEIAGRVRLEDGATAVEAATLDLTGDETQQTASSGDGTYALTVGAGGSYTVTPSKSDDPVGPANGVNVLDIALVRQDILNQAALPSPYAIIAADVDASGAVNVLDVLSMRQLVLSQITAFPAGLWRFVSAAYVFSDPTDPLAESFAEAHDYANLTSSQADENFVAVRLGDVNGDWSPGTTALKRQEVAAVVSLDVGEAVSVSSEAVEVPVRAVSGFDQVGGLQLTLEWASEVLEYAGIAGYGLPGMGPEHVGLAGVASGYLTLAWDDATLSGVTLSPGAEVLRVRFERRGVGSGGVRITSGVTPVFAHRGGDLAVLAVEAGAEVSDLEVPAAFSLSQNYPNPFNPVTVIEYGLPEPAAVRLVVHDVLGRAVVVLASGLQESGRHRVVFDASGLPSGMYVYRLEAGSFVRARRLTLLK